MQTDTIHFVNPISKQRRYVYTVIDLRSRMAHAGISNKLSQGYAAKIVLEAEQLFGFKFKTVQSDNGPEFGKWFYDQLAKHDIQVRHSRVRRPNDNAHIERFNRTLQDEALGKYLPTRKTNKVVADELEDYLDYYNHHRLHLSLQCKTPASVAKVVG
ncbi:integrase core domain-containing protein [Candidatus Saccharibacteria bacterium]|nr:integrase core domain-containing protein [Candidatus Saccharibacteria bacterium]